MGMVKREPKLLRLSGAAHELGLHPMTVRRWIKAGRIQVIPVGREVRIPRSEVERLVGKFDVTLTVLEPGDEKTPEQELTDDLLALIASFAGRLYGMRSHQQKELLQCAKDVLTSP
jgi:excisionase family DNA binding protein